MPAGRVHGLQVEIDPSSRAWTGGVYEEGARGWLNDLTNNEAARKAFLAGQWNIFRIECRGETIKTWLNTVAAAYLKDGRVSSVFRCTVSAQMRCRRKFAFGKSGCRNCNSGGQYTNQALK